MTKNSLDANAHKMSLQNMTKVQRIENLKSAVACEPERELVTPNSPDEAMLSEFINNSLISQKSLSIRSKVMKDELHERMI